MLITVFRIRGKILHNKKSFLQILEEAAQNQEEKIVQKVFRSLFWKHPDHPVFRIVLKGDPKYFTKKTKPFQVSGKFKTF